MITIKEQPWAAIPLLRFLVGEKRARAEQIAVFIALVAGLWAWCLCESAALHDEPHLIEPREFGDMPTYSDVSMELVRRGFKVQLWDSEGFNMIQITDADAITIYMPPYATLEDCLARHQEKAKQFQAA